MTLIPPVPPVIPLYIESPAYYHHPHIPVGVTNQKAYETIITNIKGQSSVHSSRDSVLRPKQATRLSIGKGTILIFSEIPSKEEFDEPKNTIQAK